MGLCLTLAAPATGAQPDEDDEAGGDESAATDEATEAEPADDTAAEKPKAKSAAADDDGEDGAAADAEYDPYDPTEIPEESYAFIGMRFRNLIVPKFLINIFAEGGDTVNALTFGPELVFRRDHLEFDLAISYADYSMDPFMFKGKDDGQRAFERVWSDMKILYFTVDVMYEWPIDDGRFGFALGGGVGLGVVFDSLYRQQVYPIDPNNPDPDDPGAWGDCLGVGNPNVADPADGQPYCDDDNSHYPDGNSPYSENSWANGGSKPFIFPWISLPAMSFRFKPTKHLQTRLDTGFSITGFYIGLAAHYGL